MTRSSLPRLWEEGIPREGEDDSGRSSYNITHHYPLYPSSLVWFTWNLKKKTPFDLEIRVHISDTRHTSENK